MARPGAPIFREGIGAGVIGAAVVASWFLLFDLARGRPLLTPALLGTAVFQGAPSPAELHVSFAPVIGYTILHGLAFIAFGVIAAAVIAASEREPTLVIAVVVLFACLPPGPTRTELGGGRAPPRYQRASGRGRPWNSAVGSGPGGVIPWRPARS